MWRFEVQRRARSVDLYGSNREGGESLRTQMKEYVLTAGATPGGDPTCRDPIVAILSEVFPGPNSDAPYRGWHVGGMMVVPQCGYRVKSQFSAVRFPRVADSLATTTNSRTMARLQGTSGG